VTQELFLKLPLILSPKKEPFLEFEKWVLGFKVTQPEEAIAVKVKRIRVNASTERSNKEEKL